jgi:hypothetical protein
MISTLEYIIVAIVVSSAALFLTRGLWSKSAKCGKSGCACSKTGIKVSKQ